MPSISPILRLRSPQARGAILPLEAESKPPSRRVARELAGAPGDFPIGETHFAAAGSVAGKGPKMRPGDRCSHKSDTFWALSGPRHGCRPPPAGFGPNFQQFIFANRRMEVIIMEQIKETLILVRKKNLKSFREGPCSALPSILGLPANTRR